MKLRVLAIVVLCALLAFVAWQRMAALQREAAHAGSPRTGNGRHLEEDPNAPGGNGAKSHLRPEPEEATVQMTLDQLKVPLPKPVAYPRQSIRDRLAALNATLKDAGIEPHVLRVRVNETHALKEELLELVSPEFAAEQTTPAEILRHLCDCAMLRYMVLEGVAVVTPCDAPTEAPSP